MTKRTKIILLSLLAATFCYWTAASEWRELRHLLSFGAFFSAWWSGACSAEELKQWTPEEPPADG